MNKQSPTLKDRIRGIYQRTEVLGVNHLARGTGRLLRASSILFTLKDYHYLRNVADGINIELDMLKSIANLDFFSLQAAFSILGITVLSAFLINDVLKAGHELHEAKHRMAIALGFLPEQQAEEK